MSGSSVLVTMFRVFKTPRTRLSGLQCYAEVASRMDLRPHLQFTSRKSPIPASEVVQLTYLWVANQWKYEEHHSELHFGDLPGVHFSRAWVGPELCTRHGEMMNWCLALFSKCPCGAITELIWSREDALESLLKGLYMRNEEREKKRPWKTCSPCKPMTGYFFLLPTSSYVPQIFRSQVCGPHLPVSFLCTAGSSGRL